jgi:hypothetical protein
MSAITVAGPTFEVETPDVAAPRGHLLDVATVVQQPDAHARSGVTYQTLDCWLPGLAPGQCCEAITPDAEKGFEAPEDVCGEPFTVYKGVGCTIFGEPWAQAATDALERGEWFAVEEAYYQLVLRDADQLTATPTCPALALGQLEQYASQHYAGRPVIHTSRLGATVLASQQLALPGIDAMLTTPLGSPIAAHSTQFEPPEGTFWLYATGAVTAYASPVEVNEGRDLATNTSLALAERTWSITTECFAVAVPVHVDC